MIILYRSKNLETNPLNMGMYNYADPSNKVNHGIFDVVPYGFWGNVPGLSVPKENTKAKYDSNIDAQNCRNEVVDEIGGK